MKSISEMWQQLKDWGSNYPAWVVELGAGLFVGLVLGFLARLLGKYAFITFCSLVILLFGLHYWGVITFQTLPLTKLFGLDEFPTFSQMSEMLWTWLSTHFVAWIALILGFMVGWKFGK